MSLVHCERCGWLYETGQDSGIAVGSGWPPASQSKFKFIGPVCTHCLDLIHMAGRLNKNLKHNPKRAWKRGWYIDWIAKRQRNRRI